MTIEIPLTQGKVALVDDEDHALISQFKWYAHKQWEVWYARTRWPKWPIDKKTYMHRMILNLSDPDQKVDHINHNGLDNRRENLRVCTQSENQRNSRKINRSSKYRGVSWRKREKKWQVIIRYSGKIKWLGYFESEIEAAKAYNEFIQVRDLHYYQLNQIEDRGEK